MGLMKYLFIASSAVLLLDSPVRADLILVPPSLANTQGGLGGVTPFAFPTTQGIRTQIVYDASLFSALKGPQLISEIQFRPIDPTGGFFGDTLNISNVRLQLSTTQRSGEANSPLSTTFADNVGPDAKTVYSGPLSLTTKSTDLGNGTKAFDYRIPLQNNFVYDPSAGNLLLDTFVATSETIRGNAFFGSFPRFDTTGQTNDGLSSLVNFASGSATTGSLDPSGPVTRFDVTAVPVQLAVVATVPEPASATLLLLGLAALIGRRAVGRRRPLARGLGIPGPTTAKSRSHD